MKTSNLSAEPARNASGIWPANSGEARRRPDAGNGSGAARDAVLSQACPARADPWNRIVDADAAACGLVLTTAEAARLASDDAAQRAALTADLEVEDPWDEDH